MLLTALKGRLQRLLSATTAFDRCRIAHAHFSTFREHSPYSPSVRPCNSTSDRYRPRGQNATLDVRPLQAPRFKQLLQTIRPLQCRFSRWFHHTTSDGHRVRVTGPRLPQNLEVMGQWRWVGRLLECRNFYLLLKKIFRCLQISQMEVIPVRNSLF